MSFKVGDQVHSLLEGIEQDTGTVIEIGDDYVIVRPNSFPAMLMTFAYNLAGQHEKCPTYSIKLIDKGLS